MIDFKIDSINSFQILNTDTLETVMEFGDISNVTVETELEPSSLSKEELSFNHEASFECMSTDYTSLLDYATNFDDKPFYIEYYVPILIQARWHKKSRINKKWLNRFGMKKDEVLVRCNVNSISTDNSYDPYNLVESKGFNMELSDMQYKFRPDQLRRNLKIVMHYE